MMFRGKNNLGSKAANWGLPDAHLDDWPELAVDYLDGRLSPEVKALVEQHLRQCPSCHARVRAQQIVVDLLQEAELEPAPADLEEKVLAELLYPTRPVERLSPERAGLAAWWRHAWQNTIRPWLPASVAVAIVLFAIVGYGILHEVGGTRQADQALVAGTEKGATSTAASSAAESGAPVLGASATTSTAEAGTAGTARTAESPSLTAAGNETVTTIAERKGMLKALQAWEGPAFLVLEAPATAEQDQTTATAAASSEELAPGSESTATTSLSPAKVADAVAQVATFTGMQPLADDLSLGGPTYAAFVARKDIEPVVDLLLSVGTSLNLTLSLQSTPSGDQADVVARLLAHRADFPLLKAQTIPSPAVSRYEFTTSSLPVAGSREGTSSVLPDDAGTHILVIFIVRR